MADADDRGAERHIVIVGAGSIGTWVGGELALRGVARVTFLQRPSVTGKELRAAVTTRGLTLEEGAGAVRRTLPPSICARAFTYDASELSSASAIIVATKRHSNAEVATHLGAHVTAGTPIVLLQNGLGAVEEMRALIGELARGWPIHAAVVRISATMIHAEGRVVRSGVLPLLLIDGQPELCALLSAAHVSTRSVPPEPFARLQRGKLMLNMLNAPNALSRLPLGRMALDRASCQLAADSMAELAAVYRAQGEAVEPRAARWLPFMARALSLRALNWALRAACAVLTPVLGRHPLGSDTFKSSMLEDIDARRQTEIDHLNGEVVRRGAASGVPTPTNAELVRRVRALEREIGAAPSSSSVGAPPLEVRRSDSTSVIRTGGLGRDVSFSVYS